MANYENKILSDYDDMLQAASRNQARLRDATSDQLVNSIAAAFNNIKISQPWLCVNKTQEQWLAELDDPANQVKHQTLGSTNEVTGAKVRAIAGRIRNYILNGGCLPHDVVSVGGIPVSEEADLMSVLQSVITQSPNHLGAVGGFDWVKAIQVILEAIDALLPLIHSTAQKRKLKAERNNIAAIHAQLMQNQA